jgi:FtsP/CotA-like multicopper oxidase with cupredoxin domain
MSQMGKTTPAQRQAAAIRVRLARSATGILRTPTAAGPLFTAVAAAPAAITASSQPDYFGTTPNYANSPLPTLDASGNALPGTGIRKFVDSLPLFNSPNNLGQQLTVGVPDTTTYPGSDYYVIALVQYSEKLHSDLPPTTLRGYVQLNSSGQQVSPPSYLGPTIVAQAGKPVRVKFINQLPTGAGGDLFLPVDTSFMGAGPGPLGAAAGNYKQNRGTLHLHGGLTPWISDGTPHQWTTPAGENTPYPKGVSTQNVPDMPDPGPGAMTFFYTNQQSARLDFYHDHSLGITRLNVYAGEAAPYVLRDKYESALINGGAFKNSVGTTVTVAAGTIPADEIPLVIQDKTFVPQPAQLAAEDPTWNSAKWGGYGNLWFPHVYMPNQNPWDISGANGMGRWDYGPWFWPPYTGLLNGPIPNAYAATPGEPPMAPGVPSPSAVPEAFMDTPLVNGTAYPFTQVGRKAYRFRVLNACNDRTLNLSLFYASGNTPASVSATGWPTLQTASGEVTMVPAVPHPATVTTWPTTWPTDGRDGGVPDPVSAGPSWIQIGSEGGFLPSATVLPPQPISYNYNRRDIVVLNVANHSLMLGPAERADVIVDFSSVPDGSKIIMYNDAPAPVPAFDPRYDYYTGDPDQTLTGGAPTTLAGYGPNTRTVMQFQVNGATAAPAFNIPQLQTALVAAYGASQEKPLVPTPAYNAAFGTTITTTPYVRIQDTTMTITSMGATQSVTMQLQPKAIQELFETTYGRMNATLGVELPNTNVLIQTTIPLGYTDPPTEIFNPSEVGAKLGTLRDGTQIWKITHNGVDTHAIHFHLFDVQIINRVGWDGAVRFPDSNELGWKETVRMNPLEDCIVAMRPRTMTLPFKIPDSIRPMDPTQPIGATAGFSGIDPATGNPITVTNQLVNYGWEYVWHCHLLGHEENDMMRPVVFGVSPAAPTSLTVTASGGAALKWTNNAVWPAATSFTVQRSTNASFTAGLTTFAGLAGPTSYTDTTGAANTLYFYRVRAENSVSYSQWSNVVSLATGTLPNAPTRVRLTGAGSTSLSVAWSLPTTGTAWQNVRVQYSQNPGGPWTNGPLLSPTATSFTITGLDRRTRFYIRVQTINTVGAGTSAVISGSTL